MSLCLLPEGTFLFEFSQALHRALSSSRNMRRLLLFANCFCRNSERNAANSGFCWTVSGILFLTSSFVSTTVILAKGVFKCSYSIQFFTQNEAKAPCFSSGTVRTFFTLQLISRTVFLSACSKRLLHLASLCVLVQFLTQ